MYQFVCIVSPLCVPFLVVCYVLLILMNFFFYKRYHIHPINTPSYKIIGHRLAQNIFLCLIESISSNYIVSSGP